MSFRFPIVALTAAISMAASGSAAAQRADWETKEIRGVGIEEQLGTSVPLDLEFVDHEGASVRLGDLFDGERPTVLTLNYANCPQLCGLQLNGFIESLNAMDQWSVGEQFQVVTVSLDPNETMEMAEGFRDRVLGGYDRPAASTGWKFLRGKQEDIRHLADTVGFHYNSVEDKGQFAHTAAVILLDPQGTVSRYLYGIEYPPATLRLSLAETASSKFVSTVDALILRCFLYDAASGTFVADAWKLTRIVLAILAAILFAFLGWLFLMERRVRKQTTA